MLSLLLISAFLVGCTAEKIKKFGKHEFPVKGPKGIELANEFQLLEPENFRDGRAKRIGALSGEYTITEVAPLLISNDEIVTVKYTSTKPVTSDWIAAYSPADVDITTTVPIKYGWCDDSSTYLSSGNGALTFNLTNLRADVGFYYFTGGLSKGVLMATYAKPVTFKNYNQPLRARIVPTGDYDEFKLLWSSASSVKPTLRWGAVSGELTQVLDADTMSLGRSDFCGSPANSTGYRDLGLIHSASLKGMKALANTKIYYRFGDDATNDYSEEVVFFVPPLAGTQPPSRPTTAILFDDLGRGSTDMSYTWNEYGRPSVYTAMSVGAEVAAGEIDVIYHGGDISYATGYLAVWDYFLDMISPMARSALYLTTVGNHESDWYNSASYFSVSDSGGECGVATTKLIPMPAPATTNEPWWSYDVGLLHFIGMSSEHDFHVGSKQYQWLEADLQSVDRSVTPWIIFGAHRAMYINSNYGSDSSETSDIGFMDMMIPIIEPLMYKYKVNLAFYGHNHVVQRHSAVLNKVVVQKSVAVTNEDGSITHVQADPQATVHLVIGTGGATFTKNAVTPYPDWNENVFYEYGYSRLTAVNATYLDWKWILGTTGEELDHLVITQADPIKGFA